jgi:hypothetical protein
LHQCRAGTLAANDEQDFFGWVFRYDAPLIDLLFQNAGGLVEFVDDFVQWRY